MTIQPPIFFCTIIHSKSCYLFLLILIFLIPVSCSDDEVNLLSPDPNIPINNNYLVTTLTESFDGSGGLAVGPDGFIYVADFGSALGQADGTTVSKINPETGAIEIFASGLEGPSGNTFDGQGNLIQANISGNKVTRITPNGEITTIADPEDSLISPTGIAVDVSGNIFVANCRGFISKISIQGNVSLFAAGDLFKCPNGLTIDDNGNLYASNFNDGNVLKISPEGDASILATINGSNNAHITYANEKLYVVARASNQIFEVTMNGEVSLIAGNGMQGNVDGHSSRATFFIPNGIDASPDGSKLYVTSRIVGVGNELNPALVRVIELID